MANLAPHILPSALTDRRGCEKNPHLLFHYWGVIGVILAIAGQAGGPGVLEFHPV